MVKLWQKFLKVQSDESAKVVESAIGPVLHKGCITWHVFQLLLKLAGRLLWRWGWDDITFHSTMFYLKLAFCLLQQRAFQLQ